MKGLALLAAFAGDVKNGWNLPPDASIAGTGDQMDALFIQILWLTGILFVVTEVMLLVFLFIFRGREGKKSSYSHGNKGLEMTWTILTALVLVWVALVQRSTWEKVKQDFPDDPKENAYRVQMLAKQFTWYFRYPGADNIFNNADDKILEKTLIIPPDRPVYIQGRSLDVIHSLFIPYMRVKQDVLPGITMPIWFQVGKTKEGKYWTSEEMRKHLGETEVTGTIESGSGLTLKVGPLPEGVSVVHRRIMIPTVDTEGKPATVTRQVRHYKNGEITIWGPPLEKPLKSGDSFTLPPFEYEIACAELCGMAHFKMAGEMKVLPDAEAVVDQTGTGPDFHEYGLKFWNWEWKAAP